MGSNSTRSVSYHNFGWAFPRSAKRPVDEGRPIALKTPCFDLPDRGEGNKHPWDRNPPGRFHTTILGGLFQAAQKGGLTDVAQLRLKRLVSTFPIEAKRINTLGIEAGLTKVVQLRSKRPVSTFPIGAKRINTLGIESTRSVSYHHFGWAFPSSAKSRVDEGRPIAFKTPCFDFPNRGDANKHPWDRNPTGRFHITILGGLFQAAQKAGLTKAVQLRSKRPVSIFPIGAMRINTLGIEIQQVGFISPFWVGFSKQRKKPG